MPRATLNLQNTKKYDLKSCPGGFVVLRRLSYGEKLERQSMAMQMQMQQRGKEAEGSIQMANSKVAQFEFANCILEHNLEDENDVLLNFKSPVDVARLDGNIGEEIGEYIDEINNYEETDEAKN